jgi:hypothetical protein
VLEPAWQLMIYNQPNKKALLQAGKRVP